MTFQRILKDLLKYFQESGSSLQEEGESNKKSYPKANFYSLSGIINSFFFVLNLSFMILYYDIKRG